MKYNRLIGNIFVVDSKLNVNSILWTTASTIVTAILLFIYEGEPISMNISLKLFIYIFVGNAVILVLKKRKVFKNFFALYVFKSSSQILIPYIIAEFLIFISLIFVGRSIGLTDIYLVAILFLISGFQRIIIQKTKALFFADISEYMDFIQVYGHVRASYFALAIFLTLETIRTLAPHMFVFDSIVFKMALLAIIFLFEIQFISNLYPYCEKHKDIENTILIILLRMHNLELLCKKTG